MGETQLRFKATDSEAVFKNLLNKIDDQHELEISAIQKKSYRKLTWNIGLISKIAATLLIVVTLVYLISNNIDNSVLENSSIAIIEKQNPPGQKLKIFLPDGSTAWLNAESKISYPEKFSDEKREITLEGEAFFDVIKNPDRPFIVNAGEVSTTVLGTTFNVKAFDNDPFTQVALQSGKVKVEYKDVDGKNAMFLEPGEAITYNKSKSIAQKNKFDEELLLGWKDGIIKFKDGDLDEIISTLSRWYGVQFEIENMKNETWSYTGSFDNEILNNVLKGISFTQDFSYEFDTPKYVIIELN